MTPRHMTMQAYDTLKARGVDTVAVVTMDTPFAMHAWAQQLGASKDFLFLSDVPGQLARSLGSTFQAGPFGVRPTRYNLRFITTTQSCIAREYRQ